MKTFKKALCLMLSVLMALSCLTTAAFAADGGKFTSSLKTHAVMNNTQSAKVTLDMVDDVLADTEKSMNEKGESLRFEISEIGKTVDFRSINAICDTLDDFNEILRLLKLDFTGILIGDLNSLTVKSWEEGLSRPGNDVRIISEFIELIEANKELISLFCNGNIKLGVFDNYIDVSNLLGPEGVEGILKETIIGFVYKKGSPEYNNANNTYKNNMDAFVYDVLVPFFTKDYLPGLDLDANSKINDLVMDIYNISFDKYIKPALSGFSFDFAAAEYEPLRKLDGIVVFDKNDFNDVSDLKYKKDGVAVQDQINTILGNYMKRILPGFTWDYDGGYAALKSNIEGSIRYVANVPGVVEKAQSKTIEQIGVEILLMILRNGDFGNYEVGLEKCTTLEEMVTRFLINITGDMKLGIKYTGKESYLAVLGDILGSFAYDYLPFTDYNGNAYRAGGGKDVFEVANYILNYILFDRAGKDVLKITTTKTESFFKKIDKLADYFGKNGAVNFNSENFFNGTASKKGLFDCIFTLDIVGLFDLAVMPAVKNAGNVSVVEFLYRSLQYFCKNWAGKKDVLPAYKSNAFTNALTNENIAKMIEVLLEIVNERKTAVITLLTYVVALGTKMNEKTDYAIESNSITASDVVATGGYLVPEATVTAGGKALTQNVDFVAVTDSREPGATTVTIKGIGLYSGEVKGSANIKLDDVRTVSYTSTASSIKLSWEEVPFADRYVVSKYDETAKEFVVLETNVTGTSYTVSGLSANSTYKFSVQAVDNVVGATAAKEITAGTSTVAVDAAKIKTSSTASSVKLSWQAVTDATDYRIERYSTSSKKWVKVTETDALSYNVTGLYGGTEYSFRVIALKKLSDGNCLAAAPATVKAKTVLSTPSSIKATYAEKSITLSWATVKNADEYIVEVYLTDGWKALKPVKETTRTVTGLSSGREYKFRITAKSSSYATSSVGSITAYTLPSAVKSSSVKTSSTPSSIKLTWANVTGATHYRVERYSSSSKKWVKVADTDKLSYNVSGLYGFTSYSFRITALKKLSNGKFIASAPITVKAKTTLGTASSLKASYTDTSITLTWSKVNNAEKYEVLRYVSGAWKKLATVTGTSYKVTGLKAATSYKLAVRAIAKEGTKTVYGNRKEISQYTGLSKPSTVKASSITATSAKITWSRVSNAVTYEVYAYVGGKWVRKGSTKNTSLTIKGLPSGTKTKVKVRAVGKLGGKTMYGTYSGEITVLTTVGKVSGLKASVRKTDSITLSWKKTTGATGYEVYTLINGKWKKVTTTGTSYTVKSLKRGTEYKFKVRAVQKISSKSVRYGEYSAQLAARTTIIGTARS